MKVWLSITFAKSVCSCSQVQLHVCNWCLQDRCAAAFEAFDTALLHHHGTQQLASLSEEEQQEVATTKAQLRDELSRIAAAAVQQVKAAATARRRSASDRVPKHQQQQQAAEAVLRGFKAQLQQIEDDCTDVAAAKQACKVCRLLPVGMQDNPTIYAP
jgi:chromosome segregation ATPase